MRVKFLPSENVVTKHHDSPHISPQIHHQNTTFFHPVFPQPSAKQHNYPHKKNLPQTHSRVLHRSCYRLVNLKNLISTHIIQPLDNAARPTDFNRFHDTIRPKPKVSALIT